MKKKAAAETITVEWVRSVLPRRPLEANKGTFGRVLLVAGSINYIGAAYLACSGAIRVGAGLVTLATPASLLPILASKLTEVTYLPLPESSPGVLSTRAARQVKQELADYNVLLIGCGLGQRPATVGLIKSVLLGEAAKLPPTVLDADGLNALAGIPDWWRKLTDNVILTPHPGEMARLAAVSVEKVQSDRAGIAKKMAEKWHKTIVLKGAYTVIATPDGQAKINNVANPGLAT
ncbi:MAG TPA: NAD(P)H-hydrate dehydratase, partial [Dehalococcoidia bacterium]